MKMVKSWVWVSLAVMMALASQADAHPVIKRKITDDPRGTVIARVLASFTPHARAAGLWYASALESRQVSTGEFAAFSRQFETATFVSFTYQFVRDGQTHRRVYHARSGRNEPTIGIPGLRSVRRYSSYFEVDPSAAVTWDRSPRLGSSVTARPVVGDRYENARQRDAELKIARAIETDIREGRVPRGGFLSGYSSQEPCDSCEAALQALSDGNDIRVNVAYLGRDTPAYRRFHRQRLMHLNTIHVSVNGGQIGVLNQDAPVMDRVSQPVDCMEPENHETNDEV